MSESFGPLRIVQVGTGKMVHSRAIAQAIRELPGAYLHLGIVETDPVQRAEAENDGTFRGLPFLSWEQALAMKPEAFLVETDELRLVPSAIRALEAGYPVFMDKPGSLDSPAFHRMCRIAEERNLPFMVGYMYRTNPAVQKALELVRTGALGDIISFEGQMSCMGDSDYHRHLANFPGGMMYYLGCHMIDLMVHFCGFPEQVIPMNTQTDTFKVPCRDQGFCAFKYSRAYSLVKASASEYNGFMRRYISVTGTQGALVIQPMENPLGNGLYSCNLRVTLNNDYPYAEGSTSEPLADFKRYDAMMLAFADYVRKTAANPYSPAYEAKLHDLVLAACRPGKE